MLSGLVSTWSPPPHPYNRSITDSAAPKYATAGGETMLPSRAPFFFFRVRLGIRRGIPVREPSCFPLSPPHGSPPSGMKTSELDYELPPELVAQHPVARRDHSRLLVHERANGSTRHCRFDELP